MKRFFTKTSKPFAAKPSNVPTPITTQFQTSSSHIGTTPQAHVGSSPGNRQRDQVGPRPPPHDHLVLLATSGGLLLKHQSVDSEKPESYRPSSYVRISWGKAVVVTGIENNVEADELDWSQGVVVYGIVGVLELFSASYLLVVSSRTNVGTLLKPTQSVYCVKGVTPIPLHETRARMAINTLSSRNAGLSRPSLLPKSTTPEGLSDHEIHATSEGEEDLTLSTPSITDSPAPRSRVQFSPHEDIKMMTPVALQSFDTKSNEHVPLHEPPSRNSSISELSATSAASDNSTGPTPPISKALATRLSFWSHLSKRTSPSSPSVQTDPILAQLGPEPPVIHPQLTLIEEQEVLDAIMHDQAGENAEVIQNMVNATAPPPTTVEEKHSELEAKIIRECIREYTKGGMYFAYNFDITRSLQHKQEQAAQHRKEAGLARNEGLSSEVVRSNEDDPVVQALQEPDIDLPLWRRVDRQYWWNEWLSKPFVDAGLDNFVLPIMQGYYQIANFTVLADPATHDEDVAVDYAVISRRSKHRAGLRYQRRGIDDEAHVANFVETETVMRVDRLGVENVFSYIQIRGSIPLFWTQSGSGIKPPPLLATDRTHDQNLDALWRHFRRTIPKFGPHTVLNLTEHIGKERAITVGYRDYMAELNVPEVQYLEYDFHTETKGMKYENISKLTATLERTFDSQGYLWISNNLIMSRQRGVFRVNCIDCLDRTNVVQSAFARHILNKQLGAVALLNPSFEGRSETDIVFNDLWANNGDAISRAYAGTSALKGDFTRTGKRDLSGLLNDGVNSLARMYTSTFSDWFCQAVIDYMLGNRTLTVFSEFLLKLQSTDPRDLIRLSRIRADAIATSVARALGEGERLLAGWTLFAPEMLGKKIAEKFEEKVLLLSARALYIVSYDYSLEKVKMYTRVPLGDIVGISKGAYILSPLEEASRDPAQNAGFVVTWRSSNQVTRVTSYSVRNSLDVASTLGLSAPPVTQRRTPKSLPATMRDKLQNASRRATGGPPLSAILTNTLAQGRLEGEENATSFAAFKVLPIDPARKRHRGGSVLKDPREEKSQEAEDDLSRADNCSEAADIIVDRIKRACEDIGAVDDSEFVKHEDVVSLAEAQRMTSVYAKMEYGVKRLLWLGAG